MCSLRCTMYIYTYRDTWSHILQICVCVSPVSPLKMDVARRTPQPAPWLGQDAIPSWKSPFRVASPLYVWVGVACGSCAIDGCCASCVCLFCLSFSSANYCDRAAHHSHYRFTNPKILAGRFPKAQSGFLVFGHKPRGRAVKQSQT